MRCQGAAGGVRQAGRGGVRQGARLRQAAVTKWGFPAIANSDWELPAKYGG